MVEALAVTWKVAEVLGTRDWQSQHGPMKEYALRLEGHDGDVQLSQKSTTNPPGPGQEIYGYLEESQNGNFPPKLKKVQRDGGGGFGGGGGKSPDQQKAIVRQHSQEMALRTLTLAASLGVTVCGTKAELFDAVKKTTDWFVKDVGE